MELISSPLTFVSSRSNVFFSSFFLYCVLQPITTSAHPYFNPDYIHFISCFADVNDSKLKSAVKLKFLYTILSHMFCNMFIWYIALSKLHGLKNHLLYRLF